VNQGGYLLAAVLFLPALGALLVMMLPREEESLHRGFGIAFSLITFALSLGMLKLYNPEYGRFQLLVDKAWIPGLNAHFKIGVDGISFWLVLLTTFLTPIVLLSAWNSVHKKVREFVVCMLVLETGMLGAFVALDIFLFYVFWEVMLIPMYLLIGVWGGNRRLYASIKFVIYTMVGSLLMLAAILYVYVQYGAHNGEYTTDIERLQKLFIPYNAQVWCFAAFALAFAIKVPLFPLHTWLPDAHVEAPTAGSVILAGVLLKFGIYGFMRWAIPLFPHGAEVWAPVIGMLAVIGIIYGALVAYAQEDVKKLIAYSSVSHLGFCVLGMFALTSEGMTGSVYAMLSHGLTTSGLFLAIGVLYERRHTRLLAEYGGLWARMPVFAGLFLICVLGSAGLPGTSGFIGEFLSLLGTFASSGVTWMYKPKIMTALAATGVILGAVYLLYMFQKVMFGKITNERNRKLKDLSLREIVVFLPLVAMIFVMGILPNKFLKPIDKTISLVWLPDVTKKAEMPDGPVRMIDEPLPGEQAPPAPAPSPAPAAPAPAPAPAPEAQP
jgi:NADH-quinone oxidoreductase subunit M